MRKQYKPEMKAQIVVEMLKEEKAFLSSLLSMISTPTSSVAGNGSTGEFSPAVHR